LGAAASAERVRQSLDSAIGGVTNAIGAPRNYSEYAVGIQASWELDFSGGLRRDREAALAEAHAAEVDADAARLMVAGEAADTYLALRGFQARFAVIEHQEQVAEKLVDLVRLRNQEGISSDRELQRATGRLEGVRSIMPSLMAAIDALLYKLDILMGEQAGTHRAELLPMADIPAAPQPTGSLTPADLLRRRPDVVAAEQRLIASNARIGSAIAEYYPHVSLGGMLSFVSVGTGNLFTGGALQSAGVAGLRWRLFDFGRVDAEVAIARGKQAEALSRYRSAILRASEDVETALSRYVHGGSEVEALDRQITALRAAREQAQFAYQNGVAGLIEVLDADRELLDASDRLAMAKASQARASVAVFRALGGGWNG
jgi:NodT family efflux transporter outer membrane factor (OMF) lipoprotein